jgi:hypothetical protein
MSKLYLPIPCPAFIERLCVWFLLRCKKIRYGHEFRSIKLTKGKYAIVSLEDYEKLNLNKWSVKISGSALYAVRLEKGKTIYMHNQIMQPPQGFVVDHQNHCGLDNGRENLRLATLSQNNCNRRKKSAASSSKYKGVHRIKDNGKWRARIGYKGKRIFLGDFDNEIDAAKAYDQAAVKYYGEFAALNFGLVAAKPLAKTDGEFALRNCDIFKSDNLK